MSHLLITSEWLGGSDPYMLTCRQAGTKPYNGLLHFAHYLNLLRL